ncbi:AarF/ABC1/UbiB kinase family protein [Sporolactobacillus sp. CPB3-1]|uniref:AarF/ABC1/UbiB kinase family protein n=1 Tax=Sporolactobacillus mangiferae TaxID=2940498 RepID=A0ABT0MC01_9BACL|nr:AarF/ABC1/UbiB kinase family protein [Sporolactobacillus mangiferae]MCL1631804.1 AarF/ABC1/UbiB kinase family protein [Sporolactobacillus mangiferae]
MIGKRIRHLKRYQEIVSVLVKYGFGYIVKEVGLFHLLSLPKQIVSDFNGTGNDQKTLGKRIRLMLEELGPTFIKLGQLLSLRTDILPEQIAEAMRDLQERVTPVDIQTIDQIVCRELGAPVSEIFAQFDEQCIAAASIAQAHHAVLKTGEEVAVKIQRPNIDAIVENDIEILWDLASLVDKRYEWARTYQILDLVEEFSLAIRSELEYTIEARTTEKLFAFFKTDERVIIPKVYQDYSTAKILTLDFINGYKYNDLIQNCPADIDKKTICERLVHSFLDQALICGIFHGDPHPGNLLFFSGNRIGYIDFGQVGHLSEPMKRDFGDLIIGLMRGNTNLLLRTISSMAVMPDDLNERQFKTDLDMLRENYYRLPFKKVHIGAVIHDIFSVTKKHRIHIPKNYTLLGKALITLEGLITGLDHECNILEFAEPYGHRLLIRRLDPEELSKKILMNGYDIFENSIRLPGLLRKTLMHLNSGKTRVEMKLPQLEFLLAKVDRAANRISFSIMLLSLSIILACIILGETFGSRSLLSNVPVLSIAITIVLFMFMLVLLSIFRSGRF